MKVNILFIFVSIPGFYAIYKPNWDSLDSRPLPQWYDDVKLGIFIHWGVFSVPSFGNEWFWTNWLNFKTESVVEYMNNNYPKRFTYQEFAKDFTAEFFNANEWAELFASSGAKYVILTSKHHEGYTMWPSKYSYSWNAKDIGPGRDLVGELAKAVRAQNLTFGLYHSLLEWYHPIFQADRNNKFQTQEFVYNKVIPEMKELIETYKPSVLWSDGSSEAQDTYWASTEFLAWLYNDSPVKDVIVTNDRWGASTSCIHGGFFSCKDRYNPGTLQQHKWENAMSIDKVSWGFRRNANLSDYYTTLELITELASTVSCGGNLLMNVGPTKDGIIVPIFEQRLRDMGKWLKINGEAIYASQPWSAQRDNITDGVWYTSKNSAIYAIVLGWPSGNILSLRSPIEVFNNSSTKVILLGNEADGDLKWTVNNNVNITFPDKATVKSEWAYVLKISVI